MIILIVAIAFLAVLQFAQLIKIVRLTKEVMSLRNMLINNTVKATPADEPTAEAMPAAEPLVETPREMALETTTTTEPVTELKVEEPASTDEVPVPSIVETPVPEAKEEPAPAVEAKEEPAKPKATKREISSENLVFWTIIIVIAAVSIFFAIAL